MEEGTTRTTAAAVVIEVIEVVIEDAAVEITVAVEAMTGTAETPQEASTCQRHPARHQAGRANNLQIGSST